MIRGEIRKESFELSIHEKIKDQDYPALKWKLHLFQKKYQGIINIDMYFEDTDIGWEVTLTGIQPYSRYLNQEGEDPK